MLSNFRILVLPIAFSTLLKVVRVDSPGSYPGGSVSICFPIAFPKQLYEDAGAVLMSKSGACARADLGDCAEQPVKVVTTTTKRIARPHECPEGS